MEALAEFRWFRNSFEETPPPNWEIEVKYN